MGASNAGLPTPYTRGVDAVRHLARLLVVAALAALPACGGGADQRFDALPGPLRTVDLAVSAAEEDRPLSEDEWASLESLHDRYLLDFDRLREEVLAPLAKEVRAIPAEQLSQDAPAMARLARRHSAAMSRVQALDDRFVADIAADFPERAALADRIGTRRTVARSAGVIRGARDGNRQAPDVLDLDQLVRRLRLPREAQAAAEPALAAYRAELARALRRLAEESIEYPSALLDARTAAGLTDQQLRDLEQRSGTGQDGRTAVDAAKKELGAVIRRAGMPRARAYLAVDEANRRGLESLCAVLPAASADALRALDERARSSSDRWVEHRRLFASAILAHPDVRTGRAPRTLEATNALRTAIAEVARERNRDARARLEDAASESPPATPRPDPKELANAGYKRINLAEAAMMAAAKDELGAQFVEALTSVPGDSPSAAAARLAPFLGERTAERLVGETSVAALRVEEPPEAPWQQDLSIAEQLLLAPGMDHEAYRRAARGLGARDDDPLVEQIWERHRARMSALEAQQREQMRILEERGIKLAQGKGDPVELERTMAEYLSALISADGERREADEATFQEVAVAIDLPTDSTRFVIARTVSAARRASLPWRRFRQGWLVGPLWEADADPVSAALAVDDEVRRTAALVAVAGHAERLRSAADESRQAGLEALRDLLIAGLRAQREGRKGVSPEDMRQDAEVRRALQRVRAAAFERRAAERAAIDAVAAVDPELARRFMLDWLRATCPEFLADGPSWRTAADIAAAGAPDGMGDAAAAMLRSAIERAQLVDDDLVRGVHEWLDSPRTQPAAMNAAELRIGAEVDPRLAALRTLRDENAWRLLRVRATLAGEPPDAFMPPDSTGAALPRPVRWTPD